MKKSRLLIVTDDAIMGESRPRKFEQIAKWIFCLTAASMIAANQELR